MNDPKHRACFLGARLKASDSEHDRALAYALVLFDAGDLVLARKTSDESAYLANMEHDRPSEGSARLFGALFNLYLGDFRGAQSELEKVTRLFGTVPARAAPDLALAYAALGTLQAYRGDEEQAECCFRSALDAAGAVGCEYRAAIVRAARSDLLAHRDHRRADVDARYAQEVFDRLGERWFTIWSRRGLAKALSEGGAAGMAELILRELAHTVSNPIERSRSELSLAEILVGHGRHDEAVPILRRAARRFGRYDAPYFRARALALLRVVDPPNAEHHAAQLAALAEGRGDPAWTKVLWPSHRLAISLLGPKPCATLDGKYLLLPPRAWVLLAVLVTKRKVTRTALTELLWPDAPGARGAEVRKQNRLRDSLSDLRRALGKAACRMSAGDDPVEFDVRGVEIDYLAGLAMADEARKADRREDGDSRRHCASEALSRLNKPFLEKHRAKSEWAANEDRDREALVDQLRQWSISS